MLKKRTKIIIPIVIVAFVINDIFTWGIIFDHYGGFESSTIRTFEDIVTDGYADIRLGDSDDNLILGIPFIFWVYGIESPPYAVLLDINDKTWSLNKILIELISIEYVDSRAYKGTVLSLAAPVAPCSSLSCSGREKGSRYSLASLLSLSISC